MRSQTGAILKNKRNGCPFLLPHLCSGPDWRPARSLKENEWMPMKKGHTEQGKDGEEGAAAFISVAWYNPGPL
jgi:hypothetical protein